ncbi:MAG: hypothetical protein VKL42_01705 [Snowella sp.]|nr:hypothetical protein [Snowella sp.]
MTKTNEAEWVNKFIDKFCDGDCNMWACKQEACESCGAPLPYELEDFIKELLAKEVKEAYERGFIVGLKTQEVTTRMEKKNR